MPIQLTKTKVKAPLLTPNFVKQVFERIQPYVSYPDGFTVSVVAVGSSAMRQLNKQYRSVDSVTDVLSFAYDEASGEVVICYPQALVQASQKQSPPQTELAWLLIHGILHILGYDHETAIDAKVMRPLERKILDTLA